MGTCLSAELNSDFQGSTKPLLKGENASLRSSSSRRFKIVIPLKPFSKSKNVPPLLSPSEQTAATQPPTPSSLPTPSSFSSGFTRFFSPQIQALKEFDDEVDAEDGTNRSDSEPLFASTQQAFPSSNLDLDNRKTIIDSIIAEEESLEVPSDEEDIDELRKLRDSNSLDDDVGVENDFSQSNIGGATSQLSTGGGTADIINSNSINCPPLVAPPKGAVTQVVVTTATSVNPQTIAHFNRLKVQVQAANKAEKERRHKAKLKDRLVDVEGYRELWTEYEGIQGQLHSDADRTKSKSLGDGLALNEPTSWYVDFQALKGNTEFSNDNDSDSRSQSSFSLLSRTNMEAQRLLFEENRKERQRRGNNRMHDQVTTDDKSVSSMHSAASRMSSVSFVRGKTNGLDYGPIKEIKTTGHLTTDVSQVSQLTSNDLALQKRAKGELENDESDVSFISDVDFANDYNVPRRQRQEKIVLNNKMHDDISILTNDDRSLNEFIYGINGNDSDMMDFKPRIREHSHTQLPDSPTRLKQYGFDPSAPLSSQIDVFREPSVQLENDSTGIVRWRTFKDSGVKSGKLSSARRLEFMGGEEEAKPSSCEIVSEALDKKQICGQKLSSPLACRGKAPENRIEMDCVSNASQLVGIGKLSPRKLEFFENFAAGSRDTENHKKPVVLETRDSIIEGMTTEAFLGLSSWHPVSYSESRDPENQKKLVVPEEYDSMIEGMTTEAFLRLSSWHPGRYSVDLHSLDQSESDTSQTNQNVRIEENSSASILDESHASTEDRRESTERCGELAEKVSDQISKLLAKYRERK